MGEKALLIKGGFQFIMLELGPNIQTKLGI